MRDGDAVTLSEAVAIESIRGDIGAVETGEDTERKNAIYPTAIPQSGAIAMTLTRPDQGQQQPETVSSVLPTRTSGLSDGHRHRSSLLLDGSADTGGRDLGGGDE